MQIKVLQWTQVDDPTIQSLAEIAYISQSAYWKINNCDRTAITNAISSVASDGNGVLLKAEHASNTLGWCFLSPMGSNALILNPDFFGGLPFAQDEDVSNSLIIAAKNYVSSSGFKRLVMMVPRKNHLDQVELETQLSALDLEKYYYQLKRHLAADIPSSTKLDTFTKVGISKISDEPLFDCYNASMSVGDLEFYTDRLESFHC